MVRMRMPPLMVFSSGRVLGIEIGGAECSGSRARTLFCRRCSSAVRRHPQRVTACATCDCLSEETRSPCGRPSARAVCQRSHARMPFRRSPRCSWSRGRATRRSDHVRVSAGGVHGLRNSGCARRFALADEQLSSCELDRVLHGKDVAFTRRLMCRSWPRAWWIARTGCRSPGQSVIGAAHLPHRLRHLQLSSVSAWRGWRGTRHHAFRCRMTLTRKRPDRGACRQSRRHPCLERSTLLRQVSMSAA